MHWAKAKEGPQGLHAQKSDFVTGIEAHVNLMLDDTPDRTVVESKTQADLESLRDLLCGASPKDNPKCVLASW